MGLTTPRYLLDTNVFSYFWNSGQKRALDEVAARVSLVTVEEVKEELRRTKADGAGRAAWLERSGVEVRSMLAGSPEASVLGALSASAALAQRGKGERECIALAAVDGTLTFVANDQNAMWIALRELHNGGGRVMGIPVFLRRLAEDAGMRGRAVEAIFESWRGPTGPTPTWWPSWITTIPR